MSTEENKAIIRRWFEKVINEHKVDRADELVAPDYVDHGALPGQAPGLEGAKRMTRNIEGIRGSATPSARVNVGKPIQESSLPASPT